MISNNNIFSFKKIQNIAYTKTVTVIYSDASDNWNNNGNTIAAAYSAAISGSNYEFWKFSGSVSGIKQFYVKVSLLINNTMV